LKRTRLGTKQQQQKQQKHQQQQLRNGQTNSKESKRTYIRNEERRIVEIGLGLVNKMDKNSNNDNEEEQSSSIGFKPDIPKIIHQQWKDERIPPKFMKWRQKWLSLYPEPDYKHMLWTDITGRQLIENHYPWFLTTYDNYEHNINRADAVRYFILYHYGGIYADLDYEPMINFYNYLPSNAVGLIESPYYWNEKTQNSLMTSPKGDLFWTDLFTVLIRNSQFEDVLVMTGPSLVDDAISITNQPTYILPCENFHRVPLGEYKDASITTIVGREVQFRLKPVSKQCGVYNDDRCHFGKHHNTVSYRTVLGNLV
jgi:mannosyltransferase OCH1-like enzyme